MKQRFLAIILALSLCLSLLPTAAFAAGELSVAITDTIIDNGSLTAVTENGGADLTYQWYKDGVLMEGETSATLYVAKVNSANDTLPTYKVVVKSNDATAEASYQLPYYTALQNGSFETPTPDMLNGKSDVYTVNTWPGVYQFGTGAYGVIWNTTGLFKIIQPRDIEIVNVSVQAEEDVYTHETTVAAEGVQFAEVNAQEYGALYQDVLTEPNSELTWSFAHRGRDGVDTLALVIDGVQSEFNINNFDSVPKDKIITEVKDGNTQWSTYTGTYVVPEGQYVTRFYFVAIDAVGGATQGNLLDKIVFSADASAADDTLQEWSIEYYVDGVRKTMESGSASVGATVEPTQLNVYAGYTAAEGNPTEMVIQEEENNTLKLYFTSPVSPAPNTTEYTVNYYKDSVDGPLLDSAVVNNVTFDAKVTLEPGGGAGQLDWKKPAGYESGVQQGAVPYTVVDGSNVINVVYEKKTNLSYTVNYYKDSVDGPLLDSAVVNNVTFDAKVTLEPGGGAGQLDWKKPVGYKSGVQQGAVPYTVVDGSNVINVVYEKKTDLSYTVKYYKDRVGGELLGTTVVDNMTFDAKVTLEPGGGTGQLDWKKPETGYVSGVQQGTGPYTIIDGNNVINVVYNKAFYAYVVEYYYDEVMDDSATKVISAEYNSVIETYPNPNKVKAGYALDYVVGTPLTVTEKATKNTIKVYYATDTWNAEDDTTTGDGIPDKYQVVLKYEVNDTKAGTVSPVQEVITLKSGEKFVEFGAVTVASTAAESSEKYAFEKWTYEGETKSTAKDLNLEDFAVTGGSTYTFTAHFKVPAATFEPSGVKYIVEHYKAVDGVYPVDPTHKEILEGTIGHSVTGTAKSYEGYCLNKQVSALTGTLVKIESNADIVVLKLYYDADIWNDEKDTTNEGDGIPDKYQVVVQFQSKDDSKGTVTGDGTVQVFTFGEKEPYAASGTVDPDMSKVSAAAKGGYKFSIWTQNKETTGVDPDKEIKDVAGGTTIQFFANWARRSSGGSVPVPEKPPALNTEDHFAYIIGYPDGTVKPAGNITRAEVATIFFRLLTDEARDQCWSTENQYSDVAQGQWFNNAISTLSNAGIINGYSDGTFRPNAPITRAEFSKIAVSFFAYAGESYQGVFSDVPAGKWYAQFVEAANQLGLVTGYPDGTFLPEKQITRAEACTIVNRTIERNPHEDQLHEDMIVWADNPAPGEAGHAWYYEQVQEATNSHGYEDKVQSESWTEILENRNWAALEQAWANSNDAPGGEVVK